FFREYGLYTGESYFVAGAPYCKQLIEDAKKAGIAEHSEDAYVIFVDGKDKPPILLLKDDGATSYHTRDMAGGRYRRDHFQMDKGVYVVDFRQGLHFKQLFKGLEMLGHEWAKECVHVEFGLMLGKDEETGKWGIFSTRKGKILLLHDLLNDAIETVKKIVAEKNPDLAKDAGRLTEIATRVGVGAVVFNDLKQGRRNDVKFDWDEVLDFSGETGPYMLYQYVRLGSVQRKFRERYGEVSGTPDYAKLTHPQERELLKMIASFPEAVERACRENEPSVIGRYLLDLSALFSSYWTATKDEGIVGDDRNLSQARIALVGALRKVLGRGLALLGLRLVDEM
ncbi:MAG: arginine--tRNA ligase, partial [Planctomycetes bacterium]|nr:arginine--tRNA ligase [Planctomycetota bacterium]